MPWLPENYGPGPGQEAAQYKLQPDRMLNAALIQPRPNYIAELVKTAAPLVAQYLQGRKNDQIANALQNRINPPRAYPADGTDQQGAPGSEPYTGGVKGMQTDQLYQNYLAKQKEAKDDETLGDLDYQQKQANLDKMKADASQAWSIANDPNGNEGPATPTMPWKNPTDGQTYKVPITPETVRAMSGQPAGQSGFEKTLNARYGIGIGDIANVDLDTPGAVQYQDEDGNQISTEDAAKLGKKAHAVGQAGPLSFDMPLPTWNAAVNLYHKSQQAGANSVSGGNSAPPPPSPIIPSDSTPLPPIGTPPPLGGQAPQPDPIGTPSGVQAAQAAVQGGGRKPLDPGTAKSILDAAGGDPDKARVIAMHMGYVF